MSLLLLTVICTPVAPAPAGIPAARTTSSKMATIFTSMPSTFYTVRLARTVLHLLRGDTGLDSDPDQLGPTSIAYIGWMVAVGSDELRSDRNLAPAGRVKIDQLGAVRTAPTFERLVEEHGLPTEGVSLAMSAKARGDDQIGNQVYDRHGRRLGAQAPENRVQIPLVRGHRDAGGDVVGPDRERDEVRAQRDRAVELAPEHVGGGRAARAQIVDTRRRVDGAQPPVQLADVVEVGARGPDAFDRAVAEGHVLDRGIAVGGQGPSAFGRQCPDFLHSTRRARRREQRGE